MPDEELVTIGRVVRPHGVLGEVAVDTAGGEVLGRLSPGEDVCLEPGGERVVCGIRPHAGRWLVSLEGVEDREAAERLRGVWLRVSADRLPEPAEYEFYVDDLVDAVVETADGDTLGRVVAVHAGAAQDLLELQREAGTTLVPMARDWLVEVDIDAGRIIMDLPAGFDEATGPARPGGTTG